MKNLIFVIMILAPFVTYAAADNIVPPGNYTVIQKDVKPSEAFPDKKVVSEIHWSEDQKANANEAKPVGESYFGRGYYKQQKP